MKADVSPLSARERLLAAADELFYRDGVHTVGIDTVIARAGVAKASLYSAFGSKDELVRAYLERRYERRRERILERIARHTSPRAKILAIFDLVAELADEPGYRGCAFANASAEGAPVAKVRRVCDEMRDWTHELFVSLARDAGAPSPEAFGTQLHLLYDGAVFGSRAEQGSQPARTAKSIARILLGSAIAGTD